AANSILTVTSGNVIVTNAAHTASLDVQGGTLTLNSGTRIVDRLYATNGAQSIFTFNSGLLACKATQISNTRSAAVGNGVAAATFELDGGIHSFANGLHVTTNATVTGCGT